MFEKCCSFLFKNFELLEIQISREKGEKSHRQAPKKAMTKPEKADKTQKNLIWYTQKSVPIYYSLCK